jgi:predicted Zn finger-like uncharacterized protein
MLAMPEEKYTRCPGCHTVFRVTPQQLAMREGQVRCGHCKTVFDGVREQISLAPQVRSAEHDNAYDEAVQGPPTVTLRNAQALHPVRPEVAETDAPAKPEPEEDISEIAYEERFAWARPNKTRRSSGALLGIAIPLLFAALLAQLLFHYRDAVAARWPVSKPVLTQACALAGCTIRPLRDLAMQYLSIDASDLQADPAHKGLLILIASVRSHAGWPLAYPDLEFSLTDTNGATVVRRVLTPAEYAGALDLSKGIAANGEVPIKLFVDASATTQAGYTLYVFYP